MEQIDHNLFVETKNLGSNNSMIVTDKGVVLIDSPHKPTDAIRWKRETEARGKVLYVVNTDHHIDHTMGNSFLGGEVISYEKTREKLAREFPDLHFLRQLLSTIDPEGVGLLSGYSPKLPTITLTDRMTLYLGNVTLELMHMKGHTANSLMVYLPEKRILFTGDNVCEAGLPSFQEACPISWSKTLRYIMHMDIELVVPGHGRICAKTEVKAFQGQMEELIERIKGEIEKEIPKRQIVNTIRFPDRIHTTTPTYQGYPEEMIEEFQRRSVSRIYDQLANGSI